jgi:fatty-acyl-CoA synthase
MDDYQLTLLSVLRRARREFGKQRILCRREDSIAEFSYEHLFRRVDRLAWALKDHLGVKPGDTVGTLAWNTQEHLELYLAITAVGATLHPVNIRLSADQIVDIVTRAGDSVVFSEVELVPQLAELLQTAVPGLPVVTMGRVDGSAASRRYIDYEELLDAQPSKAFPYPEIDERSPAALAFSSATTGAPKGVAYSHRALYLHTTMLGLVDTWGISQADTVLPIVPMYHVNAWGLPFAALWMGSALLLPGRRPDPSTLVDLLAEATFAAAVPTVWMDVFAELRRQRRTVSRVRMAICGGAALGARLLREADDLGIPLVHSYGMTEASPLVLVGQTRLGLEPTVERRLKQGYVVPGIEYRVWDQAGDDVPRDGATTGELHLRGPWIVDGYLDGDRRSETAFVNGWYHTGDIVTIDESGYVQLVDRQADIIKSGGEWISSIDLENALMEHPAVLKAAVVGVRDARWQERPRAFVVRSEMVSDQELRASLLENFPRFWLPDEFIFVSDIPLTSTGKIDKKALRALAEGSN